MIRVARIQQVLDAAADMKRDVSVIGRSMEQNFRIATDLGRHLSDEEKAAMGLDRAVPGQVVQSPMTNVSIRFKSIEQGAATQVWAATNELLAGKGGVYCEDSDIAAIVEEAGTTGVRRYAIDPANAERLWKQSEVWTGVRFEA